MERLGDDDLLCIFDKIPYYWEEKRSFFQVSKQFMKIASVRLRWSECLFPDLLFDILPSSSNMKRFRCFKRLSNTHLKLLAQCAKLQSLELSKLDFDTCFERDEIDFDDDGLCAVANACIHLRTVYLNMRLHVGDAGVVALATCCMNLRVLHLEGCNKITDESLKAIAKSKLLQNQMVHLTDLNLSKCGVHITNAGIVALVSQLSNIVTLDLSWLINVTDVSLVAIGSKCLKLEDLFLTGCEVITAEGLRGLTGHQTLTKLLLFSCYNFCWEDVESVALTCLKLDYFGLMKRIKTSIPEEYKSFIRINGRSCKIDWDVYTDDLFYK